MSIVHQSDSKPITSKQCMLDWYSISGFISRAIGGDIDELHVAAIEVVDCDIERLLRTAIWDYIIRGRAQTLKRHGTVKVGAAVKVLVRPAWSHVSIDDGKPVVWIEPK